MEKFSYIKDLTKKYLHGNLSTLRMDYTTSKSTIINIIYEDDNKYRFNYVIEINKETKETKFLSHKYEYYSEEVFLKRNQDFEKALHDFLFEQI